MATPNDILIDVQGRLKSRIPTVAVDLYPDRPDEYRVNHPIGALLVGYSESRYAKPCDIGLIVQDRTYRGHVVVIARQLNGTDGMHDLADRVRRALMGWAPVDCQPIWMAGDQFAGEIAGLWRIIIEYETRVRVVQEVEDDDGPALTQVTHHIEEH